jgi:hypothetical protein
MPTDLGPLPIPSRQAQRAYGRKPALADFEPLLVTPRHAQQALDIGGSRFWFLVRNGHIETVGSGKATRAVWASVRRYVDELIAKKAAEAKTGEAA